MAASQREDWRDYVLPRKDDADLEREGQIEAQKLADYYNENSIVVDYGCGIGRVLKYVAEGAYRVIGIDICSGFLDKAKEAVKRDNVEFYLPEEYHERNVADLVYAIMVLQHNTKDNQVAIIENIKKILKKGGVAVINFPRYESPYYAETEILHKFKREEIDALGNRFDSYKIVEGNLAGYARESSGNNEYYLIGYKESEIANDPYRVLITSRFVSGKTAGGGSSRFMKCVADTLESMGHSVISTSDPASYADQRFDLIIGSHQRQFNDISKNTSPKVWISHGIIPDEILLPGADHYISVSGEVREKNKNNGIDSETILQPIAIGKRIRPNDTLANILIIRRPEYNTPHDPFTFLSKIYNVKISDPNIPIESQIEWADLCITVGRGALESMAQGKPVIIADNRDYNGAIGDGYVTSDNIAEIAKCNFSGRRYRIPITNKWLKSELDKYNADDSETLYQYIRKNHDAHMIVNKYLRFAGGKQIHLVMPFWRKHQKDVLTEAYRPMNIIMHPITFEDEAVEWDEQWILPVAVPFHSSKYGHLQEPQNVKRNWFIQNHEIIDSDYYVSCDDDDMYESNVFNEIKKMDDDVVIISMKRGNRTPSNIHHLRAYGTNTLDAEPRCIGIGSISNQMSFVKGSVFKKYTYDYDHCADGRLAILRRENDEQTAFRPDLFALFNYYEPGRWDIRVNK